MLTEHVEQEQKIEKKPINNKARALVMNIIFISIISIALLVFVLLALTLKIYVWQVFIYALPAIAIAGISCAGAWRKTISLFFFISMLVWTTLLTLYFALGVHGTWMLFLLGIPVQVIVFLGFGVKINVRMNQKTNPILVTAMEKIQKKSKKNDE
jgi:cation transport ATPase